MQSFDAEDLNIQDTKMRNKGNKPVIGMTNLVINSIIELACIPNAYSTLVWTHYE